MLRKALVAVCLILGMSAAYAAPVDINTASVEQLSQAIKGIGDKKAQAIVDYRIVHGNFKKVDDLQQVKGIGMATIEKNRENLTVSQAKAE